MGSSWTICYCIPPQSRCKSPTADKKLEQEQFDAHVTALQKNLEEYLAEKEFCVRDATPDEMKPAPLVALLGRAYAIAAARQKVAHQQRSPDMYKHNVMLADITYELMKQASAVRFDAPFARFSSAVTTPSSDREITDALNRYIDEDKSSQPTGVFKLLGEAFARAHCELRVAARTQHSFMIMHHGHLIMDLVEQMLYVWRNQNPDMHDFEHSIEGRLPKEHSHTKVIATHRGRGAEQAG